MKAATLPRVVLGELRSPGLVSHLSSPHPSIVFFPLLQLSGDTSSAWSTLYYIFAFMKGVMLFVVLLLVGMGFQFMKRFSSKDRRVRSRPG